MSPRTGYPTRREIVRWVGHPACRSGTATIGSRTIDPFLAEHRPSGSGAAIYTTPETER